jgi:hypothetical protein
VRTLTFNADMPVQDHVIEPTLPVHDRRGRILDYSHNRNASDGLGGAHGDFLGRSAGCQRRLEVGRIAVEEGCAQYSTRFLDGFPGKLDPRFGSSGTSSDDLVITSLADKVFEMGGRKVNGRSPLFRESNPESQR